MQSQITSLEQRAQSSRQTKEKLQHAIASTQRQIDAKLAAQAEHAAKLDIQSALNGPELAFWETYLGTRIEGGGEEGVIRVVYDLGEEAVFELSVPEGGGYEVLGCRPKLEAEKVERVVERLNETREIGVLLKGMRALFREQMGERVSVR